MGTILVPFLNKKRQRTTIVIAGIFIGLFQIFHCLHFFSIFAGVKKIETFYEYISDNNFLKIFFNDSENNNIPDSEESKFEISSSLIDSVFVTLKLNLRETLTKKKRIKLLKKIFGFISGMSYSNSLFTALINLLSDNPKYPNYKFSLKILFYNIFNPGVGVILSCASLFPYCKCSEEEIDVRGIVLSILGILIGVLLMICPISIGIGLYLIQLTEKMITLFP